MSAYTTPGEWCVLDYGTRYETITPLTWEIGTKGSGLKYTVPEGVLFDVSIPRPLLWAFDPHDPRYLKAACLHDRMLWDGWTRVSCGAVFNDALQADGVPVPRRLLMWLAVSLWKYGK